MIVSAVDWVAPPAVALSGIVSGSVTLTGRTVGSGSVAEPLTCPAGIVTVTIWLPVLSTTATDSPDAGAAPCKVTVKTTFVPSDVGFGVTDSVEIAASAAGAAASSWPSRLA